MHVGTYMSEAFEVHDQIHGKGCNITKVLESHVEALDMHTIITFRTCTSFHDAIFKAQQKKSIMVLTYM